MDIAVVGSLGPYYPRAYYAGLVQTSPPNIQDRLHSGAAWCNSIVKFQIHSGLNRSLPQNRLIASLKKRSTRVKYAKNSLLNMLILINCKTDIL